jgi:hypothetical protein
LNGFKNGGKNRWSLHEQAQRISQTKKLTPISFKSIQIILFKPMIAVGGKTGRYRGMPPNFTSFHHDGDEHKAVSFVVVAIFLVYQQ